MKREIIAIDERSRLIVPTDSDKIWMSETELAELFGVIGPTIRAAIKAVYKSGVLKERETKRYIRLLNGHRIDVYNMEVVASLAFRLNTLGAAVFRKWLIQRATAPTRAVAPIIIQYKEGFIC